MKLLLNALLALTIGLSGNPVEASGKTIMSVELGVIGAASADILEAALKESEAQGADALVIVLDTPGGLLESTRTMVRSIMNSKIPVLVWVGPKGARAASAGAFITMAAHMAAMAPATNIGAAHPVGIGFGDRTPPPGDTAKGGDASIAAEKSLHDTLAMVESIAHARNRNVEMARSFVLASESITSEEASANKVIDFMAHSVEEMLDLSSGKTVTMGDDSQKTLDLKSARIVPFQKSVRHRILETLANPNLFYLLFLAGIIGLGFELTHPGAVFPGVAGAISMLLALIAMSTLPVNYGGLGLLIAGIAMMVAEIFLPSFGSLGIGGLIAFVLGSSLLIDPSGSSGLSISMWTILPGTLAIAGFLLFIALISLRAMRSKVGSGKEAMPGKVAIAIQDFANRRGQVRVEGEIWAAGIADDRPVKAGEELRVTSVEGLFLTVQKFDREN